MDFLIDNNFEHLTANGDFVTGDNFVQQQQLLLSTGAGEWKESPLTGVGVRDFINDESTNSLISLIKRQYKADGLKAKNITINSEGIKVDAERI
ncbi:MAG: hypothetical protein HC896_12855 [Bacteroidales bacterium]|nr:hypothetical protein [Bacteroidales bacterium]